jgi:hypothetical protein
VGWGWRTNQVSQCEASIRNDAFHLMEFRQMGRIDRFVSEHPIDAEHLDGLEPALAGREPAQELGTTRRRVGSEQQSIGFFWLPWDPIPYGTVPADCVNSFDVLVVFVGFGVHRLWGI